MGRDDDELTFSVGAREIYDGVTALTAEVRAMRDDHASEKRARERRDVELDEQIEDVQTRLVDLEAINVQVKLDALEKRVDPLERVAWQVRGALALGVLAIGWLITVGVIHR